MKAKFLATGAAPDYYTLSGETVAAHNKGMTEEYNLSDFPEGGLFQSADPVDGVPAILNVERVNGDLYVTLCQQVIASQYPDLKAHWRGQQVLDSADYDPDTCYVTPTGLSGVYDYEIVRGKDVAGVEGWTVRRKAEEPA
ncbi:MULTISPECIES: hypothetical protein [Halomonadaceae]|uniref:hypothetical protein n=1 Tax=Halomonadaceae TaxID=28256 RepID=UPI001599A472|nr:MULTISPECIES: hypothetical protein [Halomonas]QJQ93911.1 hypothetical protein HIO72_00445 [Halomonas sp. PA5]